jgi:hypothetical protein
MWVAEACAVLGQPLDGLEHLAEAAQIIEWTEERFAEAELHRLRGELLLNSSNGQRAAEENYHRAPAVARLQSAKLLELRGLYEPRAPLARPGQGATSARTVGSGVRVVYGGV